MSIETKLSVDDLRIKERAAEKQMIAAYTAQEAARDAYLDAAFEWAKADEALRLAEMGGNDDDN